MAVNDPLVSVVVPTYNRMRYLPEAAASVQKQSYANWELLIVDDASTDSTADYLRALTSRDRRVKAMLHSRCANPATLRNVGIARARGDYVAFLDSDDVWMPHKLAEQVWRLHQERHWRWSYTGDMLIDAHGKTMPVDPPGTLSQPSGWILAELVSAIASISLSSVLVERRLLLDAGGFDTAVLFVEDYDLWCTLAARSPVLFVPQILVQYRRHADNYQCPTADMDRWWLHICQKVLHTTDNPKARSACQQQCAFRMVRLAEHYSATGAPRRALQMLGVAFGYRPMYGAWWRGLARSLMHALWH
jgi:glycosyltransferase involved in cell wall biosynthesis